MDMNNERLDKFDRWWKKNHHNVSAHYWLTKHTRRVMHNYNSAPEQYDHVIKVLKRYNLGEYKRLNKANAEFLWRFIHPTISQRRERLLSSAVFFKEQAEAMNRKFSK
tara:strand:- start:2549 stop:2872 length:324 start_codon:yes stop_codon:yes gene_type:complete